MLHLDEKDVRALLKWDELIAAMERALAEFSAVGVQQPVRTILEIESGQRYLGVMPAAAHDIMGAKLVSYYPVNAGKGIPTHHAMILLFRTDTGEPLASIDGRLITEMRTAAVSAAITKYLMPDNSSSIALLGSGVQAGAHLQALRSLRPFDDIRVWSRNSDHAQRFAETHRATVMDAESAVRNADIVVVATSATDAVLKGAWLKQGAHVNAVGAVNPQWRELDDDVMSNTLLVDSREAVQTDRAT